MDLKTEFIYWYFNEFQTDDLYRFMTNLAEDSPHHRERDIATHNNMVMTQYISTINRPWQKPDLLGAFATAFHDVGKPSALEVVYKEERGHYKRFHGHELTSARMWEDWAVKNWKRLEQFAMVPRDIYNVGWLAENHLPWKLKDKEKLRRLALTVNDIGVEPFINMLIADASGRICDDDKISESIKWCRRFMDLCAEVELQESISSLHEDESEKPIVIMPIAPSGAGKSTLYHVLFTQHEGLVNFSWDDLRLEWYIDAEEALTKDPIEVYRLAYERQIQDKDFNQKANQSFINIVKQGFNIFVDNINLSKKRRRFFTEEARRHGYKLKAVLLPIDVDTVVNRQMIRPDKSVPNEAVRRHYYSLQLPSYGEFDEIDVYDANMREGIV